MKSVSRGSSTSSSELTSQKKTSSKSSGLNIDTSWENIPAIPNPHEDWSESDDVLEKEQYFLLQGYQFQPDSQTHQQTIQSLMSMIQDEWDPSITVRGFTGNVSHSDFSLVMPQASPSLTILRLYSEIPNVFAHPVTRFSDGSSLLLIPEMAKTFCFTQMKVDQLEIINDVASLFMHYEENLGVKLGIDSGNQFWLFGKWFQVGAMKRYLQTEHEKVKSDNTMHCRNSKKFDKMIGNLEDLLNGKTLVHGEKLKKTDRTMQSDWYDIGLFCVTHLNTKPSSNVHLSLLIETDIHKIAMRVAASTKEKREGHCANFADKYKSMEEKYGNVTLPLLYPKSYRNMLSDIINVKWTPECTVILNKGRNVYMVFQQQCMHEVKRFIEDYLKCTAPKNACDVDGLVEMAHPLGDVSSLWPQIKGNANTRSTRVSSIKRAPAEATKPNKIYIGILTKRVPHIEYLQKFHQNDMNRICGEYDSEVKFESGKLLVELQKKSNVIDCLTRLDKLYNRLSIQTETISHELLPLNKDHLLIKEMDSKFVSVTGTSIAMSKVSAGSMSSVSDSIENISIKPASHSITEDEEHYLTSHHQSDSSKSHTLPKKGRRVRALADPQVDTRSQVEDLKEENTGSTRVNNGDELSSTDFTYVPTPGTTGYQHALSRTYLDVGCGDITMLAVDAIVNAANNHLRHVGGVARAILKAAGESLDDESKAIRENTELHTGDVCQTGAGKLPCRMVLHAVVPAYCDYRDKNECLTVLEKTFRACFEQAHKRRCVSIGLPPLSAGVYAVPIESVASIACKAATEFLNQQPDTSLRLIRFIDINDNVLSLCRGHLDDMVQQGIYNRV